MDSDILGGDFGILLELLDENPSISLGENRTTSLDTNPCISSKSIEKWRIPANRTDALQKCIKEDEEINHSMTAQVIAPHVEVDFLRREVAILKGIVFNKIKDIEVMKAELCQQCRSHMRYVVDTSRRLESLNL